MCDTVGFQEAVVPQIEEASGSSPAGEDTIVELFDELIRTTRALHSAVGVTAMLQVIVDLAVETVEACDASSIFVLDQVGSVHVPAFSGTMLDAIRARTREGPCIDAIVSQRVAYAADLANDERWPDFGSLAVADGVRCLLALPLRDDGTLGALNLYGAYPNAFGIIDRAKASVLATLAGPALSSCRAQEVQEFRAENLRSALETRELIGQALGILMERERISADQAFVILRKSSQNLNIKLREVAKRLVETGEDPQAVNVRQSRRQPKGPVPGPPDDSGLG
jgi:GAF domain-containing protein